MNLSRKEGKDLRFKELSKALLSNDPSELRITLKEIEKKDDVRLIKPMIELGKRNRHINVQLEIRQLLYNLKLTKGHAIILDELKIMGPNPFRVVLISTIWNANIAALDHLDLLVNIAIEGSFEEAIECLTVIEETEGVIIEEQVLESLLMLKEYLQNDDNASLDKTPIIKDILTKVEQLERSHQ